jgi:Flp pilus assembly protein TadB
LKIKPDNKQLTIVALILYALIMVSLILIYRDLLITITAVTIMIALLFQYFVPLVRERKEQKAKDVPHSDAE